MFTGLVESVGRIVDVAPAPAGLRLRVRTDVAADVADGESVAINGVCLTAVSAADGQVAFDISPETARVTALGRLGPDALVNIERSMRADARLGGHFVQGHVDATGALEAIVPEGESYRLTFSVPPALLPLIVAKGSIAIDGVSLTVASIDDRQSRIDVQIVPFTWRHTRFHSAVVGEAVNVECDILGKYVARALANRGLRV
jgi:riboflavin synthase